jgi:protein-tyrosine phosphatase
MVDLHTHILPGMDDGAGTMEQAVRLIKLERQNGVDTIALTPHFDPERTEPASFLRRRSKHTEALKKAAADYDLPVRLLEGAEVRLTPDVLFLPSIHSFCYEDTPYMLVELPGEFYYEWIQKTLFELLVIGLTPVIAHVERYGYFMDNPQLLKRLVDSGCLAQVNCGCLTSEYRVIAQFIAGVVRDRLVHILATDTHSEQLRPPRLAPAMELVKKRFGANAKQFFCDNARQISENRPVALFDSACIATL